MLIVPIEFNYLRRLSRYFLKRLFTVWPVFIPFLALGFLLAACTGYSTPVPMETASPTKTRLPTETLLPIQTLIPADTATKTPPPVQQLEPARTDSEEEPVEATPRMGEVQEVGDGGFSFQPVIGYDVNLLPGQATLVSEDGGIVLSLAGGDVPGANALEGVMDRLLVTISEDFEKFEAGDPYPIMVDGARGLATDIDAELIGRPVAGKVTVAAPLDSQLFYAFAFTIQEPDGRWESEGSEVFDAVIQSIHFYELEE